MRMIVVTGGAGFVGSNLVAELLERQTHHIVVVDRFGSDMKWRNLAKHPVYELVEPQQLPQWLEAHHENVELIYHLGAISSTVEQNVDHLIEHNLRYSIALWQQSIRHKIRFIYMSSSTTYGGGEHGFIDYDDLNYLTRLQPLNAYGWNKHLFDCRVATDMQGQTDLPQWMGFKCFNIYGPNEYHKNDQQSVLTKIALHAVQAGNVRLFRSQHPDYKDGEQLRDMIYVKDVVSVLLWCLDNPAKSGLYNLGTGTASSFNRMAAAIFHALGREPNVSYIDMPSNIAPNYQYYTQADMKKLTEAGYSKPFTSLEDGIADYMKQYLLSDDKFR